MTIQSVALLTIDSPPLVRGSGHPMTIATTDANKTGRPTGNSGVRANATTAARTAVMLASLRRSCGQTKARRAAGTAASSPYLAGSPMASVLTAPTTVARFHMMKTSRACCPKSKPGRPLVWLCE